MARNFPFLTEAAVEFAIGMAVVILRLFSRWKLVGFRKWGGDDYFCILAAVFWAIEMVAIFIIVMDYGTNNGWTPEERARFTPEEIRRLEIGSKLALLGWYAYVTVIWSLKASMLFYYDRITAGISQQKLVRGCAIYCGLSYIAVILTLSLHCRPFHKSWQVNPDPGRECTGHYTSYPVVAALNVSTDIILVYIPIPMLIQLKIKLWRKLMIGSLLCSGVFIITAALLRCILSMRGIGETNYTAIWAIRETFVAFIVVNAPPLKPLFNPSTWIDYTHNSSHPSYRHSSDHDRHTAKLTKRDERDSQEFILAETGSQLPQYGLTNEISRGNSQDTRRGIVVTTQYETRYEPA